MNCEGLGVTDTSIRCLTNPWNIETDGDPFEREVIVDVGEYGYAVTEPWIKWSYANLWSSKTTWGGNDPPVEGDSVVVTYGQVRSLNITS